MTLFHNMFIQPYKIYQDFGFSHIFLNVFNIYLSLPGCVIITFNTIVYNQNCYVYEWIIFYLAVLQK